MMGNKSFNFFFSDVEVREREFSLIKCGEVLSVEPKAFRVLLILLRNPQKLITKEELLNAVWGDAAVTENSLARSIALLRRLLGDEIRNPRYIETVATVGYRFIASVSLQSEEADQPGFPPLAPGWPAQSSPRQNPSVAVLPFTNISGDPENEYFSDGLAEELINELAHAPRLKVIARTSAFAFKGKQEDIRNIARILGVEHIVEGSVRREGSRVRIGAQLIAATDGTNVWSERYDREMADIFALQDDIARAIATALRLHLTGATRQYRPSLSAYEIYLKARNCMAAFTRESLLQSKDLFELVIAADADFALAQSGLAMALVHLVLPGIASPDSAMPLARAAAARALELDPGCHEAQAVLGMVAALYDLDWNEAGRRFGLATDREVVAPYIHWAFSFSYLLPMGRARESVQECMRGMEDDPLNFMGGFHYAAALLSGCNAEAGESYLRQLAELHLSLYQPWYLLALSKAVRGMHKDALAAAEVAHSLAPWSKTVKGLFGGLLRSTGEVDRAGELYQELTTTNAYGAAMGLTLFHVASSDMEKAGDAAKRAVEQRDTRMILLMGLMRAFRSDFVRSDGRWSAIARTLGIPFTITHE